MTSKTATSHSNVEELAQQLFSAGTLGDKMAQSLSLSESQGMSSYETALPWRIIIGERQITGLSETLRQGASDILAQLVALERHHPFDTMLRIGIDESRLGIEPRPSARQPAPGAGIE